MFDNIYPFVAGSLLAYFMAHSLTLINGVFIFVRKCRLLFTYPVYQIEANIMNPDKAAIKLSDLAPRLKNFFPGSTQLSMKLMMLMNIKMPTIVGILTFISMIHTTFEGLKASFGYFQHCGFMSS